MLLLCTDLVWAKGDFMYNICLDLFFITSLLCILVFLFANMQYGCLNRTVISASYVDVITVNSNLSPKL